jgi:translocation and assembly module TamB
LFSRTLDITALEAGQIRIERLPETPDSAADTGAGGFPELPFRVVVERLAIGQVSLGEQVLGVAAAFAVQGEAATRDTDTLRAALTLERSDGIAGRVTAKARYRLNDRHLALDLEVTEPAGGLIARALNIPDLPALEAGLHGEGPLDDWHGRLGLSLQELASLTAEISLAGRDPLAFALVGQGTAERPVAELPWRLLDGPLDFRIEGAWHSEGTLRLDQARFETAAARLELTGSLETNAREVEARARAELKDDSLLADLIGATEARGLVLDLTAQGPLLQPDLTAEATLEALAMPELAAVGAAAVGAHATANFHPTDPLDRGAPKGAIEAAGSFQSLKIADLEDLEPLLGERLTWRLEGDLDLTRDRLDARTLALEADSVTVAGGGGLSFGEGKAELDLELNAADLSGLGPLIGLGVGGRARLAGPVTLENYGETLSAALSGELTEVSVDEPVAAALLSGRSKIAAGLTLAPDGSFTAGDIEIRTATGGHLTGAVSFPADFETLAAHYRLDVQDLAVLSEALGVALSGPALIAGAAEGAIEDPVLAGRLTTPQAVVEGFALSALALDYSAVDLAGEPKGHLAATGESELGPFEAESDYRLDATQFTLTALRATAEQLSVEGQASIPLDGAPVTAQLDGRSADLAPWLRRPAGRRGNSQGDRPDLEPRRR